MSVYEGDAPPRLGWDMWKRFAIGAILVIMLSATAVASGVLLQVHETIEVFQKNSTPIPGIDNELDKVEPGSPQTILVLGSDRRYGDKKAGLPPRSDTIIVVRLDPNKKATAVMSIPRDLKVEIPGYGTNKINTAYALGGPKLTVKTVKQLLGIPISHVVNVNFGGFQRAVNRLGCVYVDIDRRYFNDRGGPGGYATIDVKPGYQKLCGSDSLDFVRYRHTDDDFVRAARQQEFLRQAKDQVGLGKVFGDRNELLKIFGRYTQTDIARDNDAAILRLIKLAYESSKNPIHEVKFRGGQESNPEFVEISSENLQKTVDEFIDVGIGSAAKAAAERAAEAQEAQADQVRARAWPRGSCCARRPARTTCWRSPAGSGRCPCTSPRRSWDAAPTKRQPAPVRHLRPQQAQVPRLPDRAVARRQRPVLRRAGDDLEGAADPRQPDRRGAHAQAHVPALLRRAPHPADRLGDAEGRLLGLQHALAQAHQRADDGHRPLPAEDRSVACCAAVRAPRRRAATARARDGQALRARRADRGRC